MSAVSPPPSVVLIEDNPDDAEVVRRALRQLEPPPAVRHFDDGTTALSHLLSLERPELPSLILLDLTLPGAPGLAVLAELRASRRDAQRVPIVILTSSRQPEDVTQAYASGANGYIRKPLKFSEFVNGVRTAGAFFLRYNEQMP